MRRKKKTAFPWREWMLWIFLAVPVAIKAQPVPPAGQTDLFAGVDFRFRDIYFNHRVYDFLIGLTPGLKCQLGKRWQVAARAWIPVYNDYGERYKKVRLDMAVLSKEMHFRRRWFVKVSGGLFGQERYGLDWKSLYVVNGWLALEMQAGWTGFCSMAAGWEASTPERWTALGGADFYLNRWNTQFRIRGGRFLYEDYGVTVDAMRHYTHCTVGLYAAYSDKGGENGGFKVVVMLPPYRRKQRKVNFRPASNFRFTYQVKADAYANRMYITDPEENEREGWFDRQALSWGMRLITTGMVMKKKTSIFL